LKAHAKLTLSLKVLGVRADGFHLIEAEMVTLDLADELSFSSGDGLEIVDEVRRGLPVDAGPGNLVRRALAAAGRRSSVRLVKRIPSGAGLGGGSADAAAVLRWARVTDLRVAAELGADVPFCVVGGRARVSGVGEIVEPQDMGDLAGKAYTLLTPDFGVSTAAVYRQWDTLGQASGGPNDLEDAALAAEPRLAPARERLVQISGATPLLAGSGSTWFVEGEFPSDETIVVRPVSRDVVGGLG
jgi:4-diphosphocytidyl-2-C-methyl-D-erythritol kinase